MKLLWKRKLHGLACFAILWTWQLSPGFAQGTRADFERANNFRKLTENKVFRASVRPHWLAGNTNFWYRVQTGADAHEFVFVDAVSGAKRPVFDHTRLAAALINAGVKEAKADQLPFAQLDFKIHEHAIEFRAAGKNWRYDLESYELRELPSRDVSLTSLAPEDAPKASTRAGDETTLTFVNRTDAEVELFWLDAEGRRQSYGKLGAGERRSQHTFAGHVWIVVGDAKTLGTFIAEAEAATVEVDGKTAVQPAKQKISKAREPRHGLSPDGKRLAFVKDHNVLIQDLESGDEFPLSSDGNADDSFGERLHWSPDSKKLVAVRTKKGEEHKVVLVESSPKDQLQPKLHSFDYLKPGDRIPLAKPQLFDVDARRQISVSDELFPNPWSISELRWAPDSSRFTFLYNQRGHRLLRVVAVDAKSGATRAIVDEQSRTFIDYAGKLYTHYLDDARELIWMSERDGWNHLYLYDAETGRVKNQITKGEWVVRGVERVDEQARQIWFRAGGIRPEQDPYYVHYCRVNFDGSGLIVLTAGDGVHKVEFAPDNRFFIDTWSRVDLPPVAELRRADDGQLVRELERADWNELLKTGWRAPERFVAKGRDGTTDIYGVIIRPTNFDPNKKYPVIENIYAGPQSAFVPKEFSSSHRTMSELAELGFVVVQIDGMGTSHRSKAFHDVCWKNLGDAGFPDRILWIKAAAAKYPYLDLTRVGVYGGSAGGQSSTRALLAHGDFYKVAVSDCGCHDNRMDKIWWNELWMGWPIGPHYEEQSNVTQAHKLQGKLLLIVGELDQNVDPASTMQVANALVKADKDFDLLIVPGAGHGSAESPYGKRRRADFFVRHLLGVEPRSSP
ncbi:MAG: DPP IV N-terminal domain-containing protein [Verrucomicrobia bacterium]|nr:DPP IV N-terminal domain-containing protein [Verrucomicrobiota bacterium]